MDLGRSECMDSTEAASWVSKSRNQSEKLIPHLSTELLTMAVVISGASKWVEDERGKKRQQVGI